MELKLNLGQIVTSALSVLIISLLGWQFNTIRTLEMDNQLVKYKIEKIEAKISKIESQRKGKAHRVNKNKKNTAKEKTK